MKPLVEWCLGFFGVHITNAVGVMTDAAVTGEPRQRRERRFLDAASLRRKEVDRETPGAKLARKRVGQCNYANCPNHATCALSIVRPERGFDPTPRSLCEAHGDMLRELYASGVVDKRSCFFGYHIVFEPIAEVA